MTTAIMQPYFLPYIGYWQLINSADIFVVYDNIEYTKKGWFNRNRILEAGHDRLFTIPIKKASDYLPVNQRHLSDDSQAEIARTLRIIQNNYKKAPQFAIAYPVIEECFLFAGKNLFDYIHNSITVVAAYLDIPAKIVLSSEVAIDHSLKAEKKVMAICKATGAATYINAIGGMELYDKAAFKAQGIDLKFIKSRSIEYQQFTAPFVPWLSIIDVMMFNDKESIKQMIKEYDLV
jgi:hypothetical protein